MLLFHNKFHSNRRLAFRWFWFILSISDERGVEMNCIKCGEKAIKYGKADNIQTYYCTNKNCHYHFTLKTRTRKGDLEKSRAINLYSKYLSGELSVSEIAEIIGVSKRTIKRWWKDGQIFH